MPLPRAQLAIVPGTADPSTDEPPDDFAALFRRFAPYVDLYLQMVDMQLTYDALRVLSYDGNAVAAVAGEMAFLQTLAHEGKLAQGRFVARKS